MAFLVLFGFHCAENTIVVADGKLRPDGIFEVRPFLGLRGEQPQGASETLSDQQQCRGGRGPQGYWWFKVGA